MQFVEQDGPRHIAYCAEVPGANGQGKSREECLANLREAIASHSGAQTRGMLARPASGGQAVSHQSRMKLKGFQYVLGELHVPVAERDFATVKAAVSIEI